MRVRPLITLLVLLASTGTAMASEAGGHGFSLKEHGFYVVNFAVLLWLLIAMGRKPLREALADRSDRFSRRLDDARARFEQTQAQLHQAREKVARLDDEAEGLVERLTQEGDRLKESILSRAREEETKIRHSAQAALENEKTRLVKQFQADLALTALDKAEETLQSRWRTLPQERFVDAFVEGVKALPDRPQGGAA